MKRMLLIDFTVEEETLKGLIINDIVAKHNGKFFKVMGRLEISKKTSFIKVFDVGKIKRQEVKPHWVPVDRIGGEI